jgi:hypothetical protein
MRKPNKTFGVNDIMAKKGNVRENFRVQKEKTGDVTRLLGKCREKNRTIYSVKKKQKKNQ